MLKTTPQPEKKANKKAEPRRPRLSRAELQARVPLERLQALINSHTEPWELPEQLGVSGETLQQAVELYQQLGKLSVPNPDA